MVSHPEDTRTEFAERLPAAIAELRRSVEELLETFWDELYRSHVAAQAAALAQAARLEGYIRVFALARATTSICYIAREDALPIRREIGEKLHELLGLLDETVAESGEQQTG